MKVIKRDGREVDFDQHKIYNAVLKSGASDDTAVKVARVIDAAYDGINGAVEVEVIQDYVEKLLMELDSAAAKAYILYREKRNKARGRKQLDLFEDIVGVKSNEVTRENANMNADTPAGMVMKIASETAKIYTVENLLSEKTTQYVKDNLIHIHDLDYYFTKSTTCLQHPLDEILRGGLHANHAATRPCKRIETAAAMACITMQTVQNEQHGGQSIPAFDFYLAPYVAYTFGEELIEVCNLLQTKVPMRLFGDFNDYVYAEIDSSDLGEIALQTAINNTVKRVHQAMESFVHNLNTMHSRGGNQVIFSSINYGTDTSPEGRCIIRELLKVTERGVGNGETPIFPIQIWKLKKGVSAEPGDPNYDLLELAYEVTAKRFYPNYLNLNTPFNENDLWCADDPFRYKYEGATMGCRTRVYENRHGEKSCIKRGNLSFTTINLPRLALMSINYATFLEKLEECVDVVVNQLRERYDFQCSALKKQFPLLMNNMWKDSGQIKGDCELVESVLRHGTLGVGYIGLAECLTALIGSHHGQNAQAQMLGLEIVREIKERVDYWSDKLDLNFSVLATPAEGLSGKFVKRDKKDFGVISGVTDKEFYTNSNHVPVDFKISIEDKLKIESPYHALTLGGHISYVELDGNPEQNVAAVKQSVELMMKYNIGYGSINFARARCLDCGYEDGSVKFDNCPRCGSENVDVLERITG